ncbi:unnamed protein product, partial [Mesorhabditis spiculigera]
MKGWLAAIILLKCVILLEAACQLGTTRTVENVFDLQCVDAGGGTTTELFVGCAAKDILHQVRKVRIGSQLNREEREKTGIYSDKGFIFLCNRTETNQAIWKPVACWALSGTTVVEFAFGQTKRIKDIVGKKERDVTCVLKGVSATVSAGKMLATG